MRETSCQNEYRHIQALNHIFISYSHKDSDEVMKDIKWMNDNGYRVWYDEGIEFGRDFPDELATAIYNCKQFIVYLSDNSVGSEFVNREISYCMNLKKVPLPIFLTKTELSRRLAFIMSTIQYLERFNYQWDEFCDYFDKGLYDECRSKITEVVTKTNADASVPVSIITEPAIEETKKLKEVFGEVNVGGSIYFGKYPQSNANEKEPIAWRVLAVEKGKALLVSEKILDCKPYNEVLKDVTWETCTLRKWLINDFYNAAFSAEEQKEIVTTKVINEGNPSYGTDGGNDTNDKTYLLSIKEAEKYFLNTTERIAQDTDLVKNKGLFATDFGNSDWWLRTPGHGSYYACCIDYYGNINIYRDCVLNTFIGVRPALWLNLESNLIKQNEEPEETFVKKDNAGTYNTKKANIGTQDTLLENELPVDIKIAKPGDFVKFGKYEQGNNFVNRKEDIEWRVLAVENDKVLLLSKMILDCLPYNNEMKDVTWETCTLRKWLNDGFYHAAFSEEEQKEISTKKVINDDNPSYRTAGGNNTNDRVFLLCYEEIEKYSLNYAAHIVLGTDFAKSKGYRVPNFENSNWWLLSPGGYQNYAGYIYYDGYLNYCFTTDVSNNSIGVRPALWLNL